MQKITYSFSEKQDINFLIEDDESLLSLSKLNLYKYERFVVFSDKNVTKLWGEKLKKTITLYGKNIVWINVPSGEKSKDIVQYVKYIKKLVHFGLCRSDLLISIGGGVVQDLVGFIASTYMRGIHLLAIPTTLIAQVDAVTGGKTCINIREAKNILGTLYFPFTAYINVHFLKTCAAEENRQGFSEIYKYGLLGSAHLIKLLIKYIESKHDDINLLKKIIIETIRVRVNIRKKNALASNLGHSFGHAIERLTQYQIKHGDAITLGTILAINFGMEEGIISKTAVEKIIQQMNRMNLQLKTAYKFPPEAMIKAMLQDKKTLYNQLNLVMIRDIGKPYQEGNKYFYVAEPERVKNFLKMKLDIIYE